VEQTKKHATIKLDNRLRKCYKLYANCSHSEDHISSKLVSAVHTVDSRLLQLQAITVELLGTLSDTDGLNRAKNSILLLELYIEHSQER
jgi:hypothetical protein